MDDIKTLKPFEFLGTEYEKVNNNQAEGNCIFCGRGQGYFFTNIENQLWDCKGCGKEGNLSTFLELFWKQNLRSTREIDYEDYEKVKKIPIEKLKDWQIAYCRERKRYIFPQKNKYGSVVNLCFVSLNPREKIPKHNISGCQVELINLPHLINNDTKTIYICEGFNDTMVLEWLFEQLELPYAVIGLPGVQTLKKQWINYFFKRNIIFCLDNDQTAEQTFVKHVDKLTNIESISKLNWPIKFPNKFDITDLFNATSLSPRKTFTLLQNWIKPYKKDEQNIAAQSVPQVHYEKLPLNDLLNEYSKWMNLNENLVGAIKVALATVVSTKIFGKNPVWVHLVGAPGSGKTTILNTLAGCKNLCYYQSSLRATSLISGYKVDAKGVDPSILARINGMCLILKDYTEVLRKPITERQDIYGILSGAFDGYVERDFGNKEGGNIKHFNCHFSLLAGVTKEIEAHSEASLGERWLKYYVKGTSAEYSDNLDAALQQVFHARNEDLLKGYVNEFLMYDYNFDDLDKLLPTWFREKLKNLALLVVQLRTEVRRHLIGVRRNQPIYLPEAAVGTREHVQLAKLAMALTLIEEKEEADDEIYRLVKKVAFDSAGGLNSEVVCFLAERNDHKTEMEISDELKLPRPLVSAVIKDLLLTNVIMNTTVKMSEKGNMPLSTYRITPEIFDIWKKTNDSYT